MGHDVVALALDAQAVNLNGTFYSFKKMDVINEILEGFIITSHEC